MAEAISATRTAASDCLGIDAARDARVARELDLACNGVGPEGAKALAAALDDAVEELDLGNNGLGDEGAKWVSKALGEGPNQTTTRLGLAGNNFGPDGAWWIADALSVNRTIARLDSGRTAWGMRERRTSPKSSRRTTGFARTGRRRRRGGFGSETPGSAAAFVSSIFAETESDARAEAMMDAVDAIGPGECRGSALEGMRSTHPARRQSETVMGFAST